MTELLLEDCSATEVVSILDGLSFGMGGVLSLLGLTFPLSKLMPLPPGALGIGDVTLAGGSALAGRHVPPLPLLRIFFGIGGIGG